MLVVSACASLIQRTMTGWAHSAVMYVCNVVRIVTAVRHFDHFTPPQQQYPLALVLDTF
jgi:hypothetical protein